MYYTQEEQENTARKLIEDYRDAAQLFTQIKGVIETFNGKVFNCRFEQALRGKTGNRVYCKKANQRWIMIYIYSERCNQYIALAAHSTEDLIDGKRIDAKKFLESGREYYTKHLKIAASIEAAIEKAPEIKKQVEELARAIQTLTEQIDCYEAREIFGLNYRVTTY